MAAIFQLLSSNNFSSRSIYDRWLVFRYICQEVMVHSAFIFGPQLSGNGQLTVLVRPYVFKETSFGIERCGSPLEKGSGDDQLSMRGSSGGSRMDVPKTQRFVAYRRRWVAGIVQKRRCSKL